MGLLMLPTLSKRFITHLLSQLDHCIKNRLRPRRTPRHIEINRDQFVHAANSGGGVSTEHASSDGASPHGDDIFGFRHLFVETNQSRGHFHRDGTRDNQQIRLPR